jgi:hypothetical protein
MDSNQRVTDYEFPSDTDNEEDQQFSSEERGKVRQNPQPPAQPRSFCLRNAIPTVPVNMGFSVIAHM